MTEKRKIIFSFDDGPAPVEALNVIFDILKENGIMAEFYLVGGEVEKYADAARSIVAQGHRIQNHTWSHIDLVQAGENDIMFELAKTQEIIEQVTGVKPTKIRPPYGAGGWPDRYDPKLLEVCQSLALTIHNWDIDTDDWRPPKGIGLIKMQWIEKRFIRKQDKDLLNVLMHVQNETARDLSDFITYLQKT